jgi:hypothetical protein
MSISSGSGEAGTVLATFRLPIAVKAQSVHVVGDFNDWSTTSHPMETDDQGFIARVPLEAGRRYRFRYLLDDERWENDWAADDYVDNELGGTDSVLDLTRVPPAEPTGAPTGQAAERSGDADPTPPAPRRRARKGKARAAQQEV